MSFKLFANIKTITELLLIYKEYIVFQAAELKIDSTPAEGFDNDLTDNILGLQEKGLKSVVLMYIRYRHEDDYLAKQGGI